MPLEATVMVIDNSESMLKGDYPPTRFDAQSDAVNVIFRTKTDLNPENSVGVITSAGKCPEVLVTPTKDLSQILQGVHTASRKIGGEINIPTAIDIAQLALKHRENENLRQRIIVFVGSPLKGSAANDEKEMIKLAKELKKNDVAVDIVTFGDGIEEPDAEGKTLLKSFVENVNSRDNSHLVSIAPGTLLSDAIISSPVLAADRGPLIPEELQEGGGRAEASGAAGGAGCVDPNLDPEIAMVLRLSMQEAQSRDAHSPAMTPPTIDSTGMPSAPGIFGCAHHFTIGSMTIAVTPPSDCLHLTCIILGLGAFLAGFVLGLLGPRLAQCLNGTSV